MKMARQRGRISSRGKLAKSARTTGSDTASVNQEATSEALARWCAEITLAKKAEDVILLDLQGISAVCDFFVLASGTSEPHVQALADWVRERLEEDYGIRPWHVEGEKGRRWILLDYVDWVVHVFHRETRDYYQLERLWSDAPQESFPK